MKIGVVSQWYPPEPAFIPANVAEELTARGHEVRVLTGFPNYPDGRIYPGYRQRWRHESVDGAVTTRRVPLYPNHDTSGLRRAGNYLSFAATSALAALRYLAPVDVVYVYLTPATVFAAPALLSLLYRTPSVLHVQDLWPESVTGSAMAPSGHVGKVVDRTIRGAMRRVYRTAASIAVIAPSMREMVVAAGADPGKVRVVLNWADEALFHPVPPTRTARTDIGHRNRCTIMYAGNIGPMQNLDAAVRAAAAVDSTGQVDLVLVGSGVEEDSTRALAAELNAGNIRFLGRRDPAQMPLLYSAADFQLVTLKDLPIFRGTIPSKLQAALSCGSPVVVSVAGDCAALVERERVGLSCPPEDWQALASRFVQAAALSTLDRAEMARRARASYKAHMSRQAGIDQLEDMLVEAGSRKAAR